MQIGPYTIEGELGRGGMGAVYLGRTQPGAPLAAIKVLHADLALDETFHDRFAREADALSRLNHPGIVRLRERGAAREVLWLAMDYVPGETLAARLQRSGPWTSQDARALLLQLCAALEHAHQAGILHRDLKPENVLLGAADGRPWVVDFGLARPLDRSQHLTQTGEILGSPGYLAPEQCGGPGGLGPATDVYGLGGVLYATLTGLPPLRGTTLLGTLDLVLTRPPSAPSTLAPGVDPRLEAICLRCLAKRPEERYASAAELADALERLDAPPARSRAPLLVTGGVLALGLGLGAAWALGRGEPPTRPSVTPEPTPLTERVPEPSWEEGPWGARHQLPQDLAGLEARVELLLREQGEVLWSGGWRARRAQALELASALGRKHPNEARVLEVVLRGMEDVRLHTDEPPQSLPSLRDEARSLLTPLPKDAWRAWLQETLARLELRCWRQIPTGRRSAGVGPLLAAWVAAGARGTPAFRALQAEAQIAIDPNLAAAPLSEAEAGATNANDAAWVEILRERALAAVGTPLSERGRLLRAVVHRRDVAAPLRERARLLLALQLPNQDPTRAERTLRELQLVHLGPASRRRALLARAHVALRRDRLDEASRLLDQSDPEPSSRQLANLLRAELCARQGAREPALAALARLQGLERNLDALVTRVRVHLELSDQAEAERLVSELSPKDTELALGLYVALRERIAPPTDRGPDPCAGLRVQLLDRARAAPSVARQALIASGDWERAIEVGGDYLLPSRGREYATLVTEALWAGYDVDADPAAILAAGERALGLLPERYTMSRALIEGVLEEVRPEEGRGARIARVTGAIERGLLTPWGKHWEAAYRTLVELYLLGSEQGIEYEVLAASAAGRWASTHPESVRAATATAALLEQGAAVQQLERECQRTPLTPARCDAWLFLSTLGLRGRDWARDLERAAHRPLARKSQRRRLLLCVVEDSLEGDRAGAADEALRLLARIERWCPPRGIDARLEYLRADALVRQGHLGEATLAIERGLDAPDPSAEAELLVLLARVADREGDPAARDRLLAQASELPQTWQAHLERGRLKGSAESVEDFAQALALARSRSLPDRLVAEAAKLGIAPTFLLGRAAALLLVRDQQRRALDLLLSRRHDPRGEWELRGAFEVEVFLDFCRSLADGGQDLPPDRGLRQAKQLTDAERARAVAQYHACQVRRVYNRGLASREHIEDALRKLDFAAAASRGTSLDLDRALLQIDLARSAKSREESRGHAEQALQGLRQAFERTKNPRRLLRVAYVESRLLQRDADASRTLAAGVALARAGGFQEQAEALAHWRSTYLHQAGLLEEALANVRATLRAPADPVSRSEQITHEAVLLDALGSSEGLPRALRRLRAIEFASPYHQRLRSVVFRIRVGDVPLGEARALLEEALAAGTNLKPVEVEVVRRLGTVARAAIRRQEGHPEDALRVLSELEGGGPVVPGMIREKATCLLALKRERELVKWARAWAKRPGMASVDRLQLERLVERYGR